MKAVLFLCFAAFTYVVAQTANVEPWQIIYLPSQNSLDYGQRPIAAGVPNAAGGPNVGVSVNLGVAIPTPTVCLAPRGATTCAACDPAFANAPVVTDANGVANTIRLGPWPAGTQGAWNSPAQEAEGEPRLICAGTTPVGSPRFFAIQTVWDCNPTNLAAGTTPANAGCGSDARRAAAPGFGGGRAFVLGQTVCCVASTSVSQPFSIRTGVCINPAFETCCGGRAVVTGEQKCCSQSTAVAATNTGSCPCGPSTATNRIPNSDCPASEPFCCVKTKYNWQNTFTGLTGRCYNPNTFLCCDTGDVFDPAVQQCCPINGLQSVNAPCPCERDLDCQTTFPGPAGQVEFVRKSMSCCKQTAPPAREALTCTANDNFPSGTGPLQAQRCSGRCIDLQYQICCNGAACIREYEKCCNNTCCNTFVGTCATGFRPGAAGNRFNSREFEVYYEQCSIIEVTNTINVWWIYILPTGLLLATLLGFAIALAFLNVASRGHLSFIEKAMVFFAVVALLCSCLLFFAPVYKYGIAVVLLALLAIVTAAARVRWLNIVMIVAALVALWYIIDPFNGNDFWGVGYRRLPNGKPDPWAAGMWITTGSLWHNITAVNDPANWCVDYYDYFRYDPELRDRERLHNPVVTTFGYCSRGWITALLIMEGFITLAVGALFFLSLIALLLRFRKIAFEPIELEVVNE